MLDGRISSGSSEFANMCRFQEVQAMWEEVQEELKQKKVRTEELKVKLTQSEAETTEQVRLIPHGPPGGEGLRH